MTKSERSPKPEVRSQRRQHVPGLPSDFGFRIYFVLLLLALSSGAFAQEKITYDDHITPIFRNNCFKCHNPDKMRGELDLTTYSTVLTGGGSGKAVVPGDAAGSKLYKAITHAEEPFMPDKAPKLPDAEIELVRKGIAGGLVGKSD